MKSYKVEQLRNVSLVAHSGAGKTSLTEAMLFNAGAINRMGKVEEGNTVSDYDAEEIRRQISVNTAVAPWQWDDHKVNVLDTPGYADFVGDVKGAIRVSDAAIVVLCAASGVEVGTELVWQYADERELPRLAFINKMDRDNANFQRTLDQMQAKFRVSLLPLQIPIGSQANFEGVVDLLSMQAYLGDEQQAASIPAEMQEQAQAMRIRVVEAAAEADDDLIMKYLEGGELSAEEVHQGLAAAVSSGAVVPVLCGSAINNIGVRLLQDAIVRYLPSPSFTEATATQVRDGSEEVLKATPAGPLAALVFKTMADPYVGKLTYFRVYSSMLQSDSRVLNANKGEEERIGQLFFLLGKEQEPTKEVMAGDIGAVAKLQVTGTGDTLCDKDHPLTLPGITFPRPVAFAAVAPKTKADLDKMGSALSRLVEEDPTIVVEREVDTGETVIQGMGDSHIDIAVKRLQQKFGVEVVTSVPKVPYKETITKTVQVQGRHKKQTGGRGQFGDVWVRFEPLPRGAGFEFVDEVYGGHVPRNFIPAVEKGLREILPNGVLAGYPAIDFRAALYDGSSHPVDSSEIAFKLAAHLAFKKGMAEANPILLEPVMKATITVPEQFMGDVLGDLNTKRARVLGMEQQRGNSIISAEVPLAEMQRYAADLRSMTQGRGYFAMEFERYDEVPTHIAQGIIEHAKKEE
ncbi:MAG: elongation factor G [Anaerolineae bacterium SM23_84]|nr:MAG: elongation factor G [Anaerolineae bacterium SM23_84]